MGASKTDIEVVNLLQVGILEILTDDINVVAVIKQG